MLGILKTIKVIRRPLCYIYSSVNQSSMRLFPGIMLVVPYYHLNFYLYLLGRTISLLLTINLLLKINLLLINGFLIFSYSLKKCEGSVSLKGIKETVS